MGRYSGIPPLKTCPSGACQSRVTGNLGLDLTLLRKLSRDQCFLGRVNKRRREQSELPFGARAKNEWCVGLGHTGAPVTTGKSP
jgi:hypothetical protein